MIKLNFKIFWVRNQLEQFQERRYPLSKEEARTHFQTVLFKF